MQVGGRKNKLVFNEINITPLTDIFLVLLIIMMVVAPMLNTSGLKLSVPTVSESPDQKTDPKTIDLAISAEGAYTVEGQNIEPILLNSKLRQLSTSNPDGVIIKTNTDATHERLTFAMDAAQSAGITKVAVMAAEASQ